MVDGAPPEHGAVSRTPLYLALRRQGHTKAAAVALAAASAPAPSATPCSCDGDTAAPTPPATPPAYAPSAADGPNCGTCAAFRLTGDPTAPYGYCLWFDQPVSAAYTCAEWAPGEGVWGEASPDDLLLLAKAGEQIAGNLCRSETGEFGLCDESGGGGGGDAEATPEASAEAAFDAAAAAAGLDPRDAAVLADPAKIKDLPVEEAERLSSAGLLVRNDDGSYAPSELGQQLGAAVQEGDAAEAAEAVAESATDSAAEGKAPLPAGASPSASGDPPKGGAGGAASAPSPDEVVAITSQVDPETRAANERAVADNVKLDPDLMGALTELKDPEEPMTVTPENGKRLAALGLATVDANGVGTPTEAGRALIVAAQTGDAEAAAAVLGATAEKLYKRAAVAPPAPTDPVRWGFHFTKIAAEQRIVEGYASSEALDSQPGMWKGVSYEGDVVDADAINAALPDYLEYANIREMHQPSAVGVCLKAEVIPGEVPITLDGRVRTLRNPLYLVVKVVDDTAWSKVRAGVYKGFSIGGAVVRAAVQKLGGRVVRRIQELALTEISLVDRPANPDARIVLWKAAGVPPTGDEDMPALDEEALVRAFTKALAANTVSLEPITAELIQKAAEPSKVVSLIQQLRNEAELEGDVDAANMYTQAITLVLQAAGEDAASIAAEEAAETDVTPPTAESEPAADPAMITQSARTTTLRKAGRVLASKRMEMMRPVVKNLLQLMADAGDDSASRALKAYGMDKAEDGPGAVPADAEAALGKALGLGLRETLAPLTEAVAKVQQDQAALADVLDSLSRVARPGGPARAAVPVTKSLTTDPPAREAEETEDLHKLRHLANTEPEPRLRAFYQQRLHKLTTGR